jgi:hypothetical protein
MYGHHNIKGLVEALKHLKGYFVMPVEGDELVILRKEEFDQMKEGKKEVQLGLEKTVEESGNYDEEIGLANEELAKQQMDYGLDGEEMASEPEGQLGVGPRKKVRFEPLRGDLPPELQE